MAVTLAPAMTEPCTSVTTPCSAADCPKAVPAKASKMDRTTKVRWDINGVSSSRGATRQFLRVVTRSYREGLAVSMNYTVLHGDDEGFLGRVRRIIYQEIL